MWHFISPTMEVAAGAALEKSPKSHLWMIVIHLTTMQASQGANELLVYDLMPYFPDVMNIAACHTRARSRFIQEAMTLDCKVCRSEHHSIHQAASSFNWLSCECGHPWPAQAGIASPLHACSQGL